MSGDGPSKLPPGASKDHAEVGRQAEPLDDIILGDEDPTDTPPVVTPRVSTPPIQRTRLPEPRAHSAPPPVPPARKDRTSNHADALDGPPMVAAQKGATKMTLRIPHDELGAGLPPSTPVPSAATALPAVTTPSRAPSALDPTTAELAQDTNPPLPLVRRPARDASPAVDADPFEPRAGKVRDRLATWIGEDAFKAPAVGIDASHEAGWTPFQPEVEPMFPPIKPMPIVELRDPPNGEGYEGYEALGGMSPHGAESDAPDDFGSSPTIMDEIPVEMDLSAIGSAPDPASDEDATFPRLPEPLDSEEIRIDDSDRVSETSEVELAPEDLMSVESLPPALQGPSAKSPAVFSTYGIPTATSLMAAAPAPAPAPGGRPPVTPMPIAPPTATATATATATRQTPAPVQASAGHAPVSATTPNVAARRPSNPLVFVPPVGALAPPPMTDNAANRKKIRPWWEELFNDDFIRTMAKVTDGQIDKEVTFIEESLGCEAGAMILDLACGTGRHAVELAMRGYQIVGFDLSLAMLARASDEAQDRRQKINFVQGDMREMTFEETFDGVYSWNTSFGYFDEEKNSAVIARVHRSLKKGGQFLLDVVNRDYIIRQAPSLAWFEGDGCICMDEMTIDFITSRMKVKRTLMMDDGRTKEIEYSIRAYALHELGKMLHDNGFRVAEVSGRTGTPGVFFGCESPRTLILAEKR